MSSSNALITPSTTPRMDRGMRFWELSVPLAVLQRCAGNPLLLAAWLTTAALLFEDDALRGTPRPIHELLAAVTQQLGIDQQQSIVVTSLLVALEERHLLAVSNEQIVIPWAALAESSLHEAQRRFADVEALAREPVARHHQDALPGIETV